MKKQSHLATDIIPGTAQFVSPAQKTAAPYLPPTLLNYFHSGGHTDSDSLRQQLLRTNEQDNTMNASSRQDTPSTLSQWSSQSEEIPSYSKFTLGLPPSFFPSFLFPQQVVYEKHTNPRTSYDKQNSPVTSIHSLTSSSHKYNNYDMSFGSAASAYDKQNDSATFNDSSTSFCDGENTLDSNTHVDDFTTPPLDQRKRRYRRVTGRTATPIPVEQIEHTLGPLNLHIYKQRPQLKVARSYVKHHRDKQTTIPTRAKPEVAFLTEFYSPNRDPISPTTPMPQPLPLKDESLKRPESSPTSLYSLEDISDSDCPGPASEEDCPTSPNKAACGGIKPPCFKLKAEFSDEPDRPLRAQTITDKEFYHFINGKEMATVMFYIKGRTCQSNLQVWDTEAKEETIDGDQAYGIVNCDAEPELCVREHIPSVPYFKIYCGGYPVYAGKRFKIYHS